MKIKKTQMRSRYMQVTVLVPIALTLLVPGCSHMRRASVAELASSPEPYVQVIRESNVVQLQIAARRFVPARGKGPGIWLTGVSHIGESNYFARLQEHLEAQTLVLFEGISDRSVGPADTSHGPNSAGSGDSAPERKGKLSSLQLSMADSLGLAFQLEAIDYTRPNFRNSDLSVQQLRELVAETGAGASLESLLNLMEGGSWLDAILQMVLRFLGTNPKFQGLSKLALMETIGQIRGDPSELRGLPPQLKQLLEVLIARRNAKVIADLKEQIQRVGRRSSIAVFYGTGHMPDMEQRLRRELGYRPAEQLWFTAFSVDLAAARISEGEWEFVHSFVKREMEQLQSGR